MKRDSQLVINENIVVSSVGIKRVVGKCAGGKRAKRANAVRNDYAVANQVKSHCRRCTHSPAI